MRRLLLLLLFFAPQDKSTLKVCWTPPATLDPLKGTSLNDARVLAALFEGLVTFDADHVTPVPGAAEKWEVSKDGLTWTFTLRESKWSDGEPVVASDFVAAWRRAFQEPAPYASLFEIFRNARAVRAAVEVDGEIAQYETLGVGERRAAAKRLAKSSTKRHVSSLAAMTAREKDEEARRSLLEAAKTERPDVAEKDLGFEAVDARTLRCVLERPAPHFLDLLGFMPFYPVSPKTAKWTDHRTIPTNGPYKISAWDRYGATLTRVRGEGPEKVLFEWRDPDDAYKLFEQGRVDWLDADTIPASKLAAVAQKKEFQYFDLWATAFLRLNTTRGPFAKPGVRKAFAHAIDRLALREAVRCNPAERLVPPGFPGYPDAPGLAFNKSKAFGHLLKEYPDTSTFPKVELLVVDMGLARLTAQVLHEQWEKVLGITVKVRAMKPPAYFAALSVGEYDMALGAWAGDIFDPVTFLELWAKGDPRNLTGWSGADYDKLLAAAAGESDPKARLRTLAQAEGVLLADAAVVPLYTLGSYQLVHARVRGVVPNLMGRVLLQHVRL